MATIMRFTRASLLEVLGQDYVRTARAKGAVERLPLGGQYGVECLGLRASSLKRLAQAANGMK